MSGHAKILVTEYSTCWSLPDMHPWQIVESFQHKWDTSVHHFTKQRNLDVCFHQETQWPLCRFPRQPHEDKTVPRQHKKGDIARCAWLAWSTWRHSSRNWKCRKRMESSLPAKMHIGHMCKWQRERKKFRSWKKNTVFPVEPISMSPRKHWLCTQQAVTHPLLKPNHFQKAPHTECENHSLIVVHRVPLWRRSVFCH